ncbi:MULTISPECIES: zf-HC2 domain-containing protein [unclassified Micromonospora]|uniref:zf-HC2 domain-containing protein n=1 Tax=unclassified Micromonospora TaxID=2617518 RepID=UPI0033C5C99C
MADDVCDEPQLRSALGVYLAGELAADQRDAVESHLATCAPCSAEADALTEAVAMLALLSDLDRRELVAEYGVPPIPVVAGPDHVDEREAEPEPPPAPEREPPAALPAPPATARAAGPTRGPAVNRARTGPGGATSTRPGRQQRRQRMRLAGAGLAVVALIFAGLLVGQSLRGQTTTPDVAAPNGGNTVVTLVTNATDMPSGATLSVVVSQQDGAVNLRATLAGLRVGEPYRLFVTDVDGQSWELAVVTGVDFRQEVARGCPVPIERLDRFSVTAADGSLAVVAVVDRASPSVTPR